MNLWAVRGGPDGEFEDYAFQEGVTMIDFGLRRDATEFEDRESLRDYLAAELPIYGGNLRKAGNAASQIWKFATEIRTGDMLLLPRKRTKTIAVGKVAGEYRLDEDTPFAACHARAVEWIALDVPRENLDPDILKAIRSLLTVFQVSPGGAAERIMSAVAASPMEGETPVVEESEPEEPDAEPQYIDIAPAPEEEFCVDCVPIPEDALALEEETPDAEFSDHDLAPESEEETPDPDIAPAIAEISPQPVAVEFAATSEPSLDSLIEDRVIRRVRQAFPGARIADLVASILRGYGYTVAAASPSDETDRIHILAGRGDMGFDGPGLLAHLSLSDEPASAEDCQRLRENARAVGAQRCLLVSMAGFADAARRENERSFFTTRLWDAGEVVANLMDNYDRLPADIRAAVPMQTRRTLVES